MKYRDLIKQHKAMFEYRWVLLKVYQNDSLKFEDCKSCRATVPVRGNGNYACCELCDKLPSGMEKLARLSNMLLLMLGTFDDAEVIDET